MHPLTSLIDNNFTTPDEWPGGEVDFPRYQTIHHHGVLESSPSTYLSHPPRNCRSNNQAFSHLLSIGQ